MPRAPRFPIRRLNAAPSPPHSSYVSSQIDVFLFQGAKSKISRGTGTPNICLSRSTFYDHYKLGDVSLPWRENHVRTSRSITPGLDQSHSFFSLEQKRGLEQKTALRILSWKLLSTQLRAPRSGAGGLTCLLLPDINNKYYYLIFVKVFLP